MKKSCLLLTLAHCFIYATLIYTSLNQAHAATDEMVIEHSHISTITLSAASDGPPMSEHPFVKSVAHNLVQNISDKLDHGQPLTIFNESKSWSSLSDAENGDASGTHLLRFSLHPQRYTKGTLKITGAADASLFLNTQPQDGDSTFDLTLLNQDYRALLLVSGVEDWQDFTVTWTGKTDADSTLAVNNDQGNKRPSMRHFYDSQTVGSVDLSPDGRWLVWSKQHYTDKGGDTSHRVVEILDMTSSQVAYRFQAMRPANIAWRQDSQALVFTHNDSLFMLSLNDWSLNTLATDVKGVSNIHYVTDNQLIFEWNKPEKAPSTITKRYRALEDRWSYWRGEQQLHRMDIESGLIKQLTNNPLKTSLLDVSANSALITRSPIDYTEPPHGLTQLLQINLTNGEETLLGQFRTFNSAHYINNNKRILIVAGPNFNNGLGINLKRQPLANDYDGQLYLMDASSPKDSTPNITALSKNFDPSIRSVEVLTNGNLSLSAIDQDRVQLFTYDFTQGTFTALPTQADVVTGFTVSQTNNPTLVYKGTTASAPQQVIAQTLNANQTQRLFDSASQDFTNINLIDVKDWDYTTQAGQLIDGRVYYPANFDDSKQYPAIIYYYGGTTPVTRGFTGRYPFNWYASMGYVVYVLQPSGTIGYGQDYSAKHVNAWGIHTADDIIESTQAFVDAHAFVDKDRLGNMGASYGGFMTMYLATQTDMFAASISHAGISNLTSYWGHGWWGYGYSGIATRGNWPWNNPELYVQQSPVYAADKVTTPLLLVHGDADTNVPVGESHQMYTALKLLGQDVELVEFLGDDHHINSRERRFVWWQTKLAYFDKYLKDEPQWWDDLFPSGK